MKKPNTRSSMRTSSRTERKNLITLMLVPHFSGKPLFSIRLYKWMLYFVLTAWIGILVIFFLSLLYSSSVTRKLINYSSLIAENKVQKHQINNLRKKMTAIDSQARELFERDQHIRGLLGLGSYEGSRDSSLSQKKKLKSFENYSLENMNLQLDQYQAETSKQADSYSALLDTVQAYLKRFSFTPSIPPIYGRVGSGFGWRRHPILGVYHLHSGVDFPTWRGALVKATASGVIEEAGWKQGYGRAVVINHQYGLKTLYGHNSRLLVSRGMHVKKGQVIAEAGSTGLSTGVHVHYEVRRGDTPIQPNRYLSLNLFTAAKQKYW